ncbi:hypothetical protein [Streptomyces tendae]|uniref:hypothetical protein n=1 Tax=Streptomyces tendae TaxID=1932 RepID=UPI00371CCEFA
MSASLMSWLAASSSPPGPPITSTHHDIEPAARAATAAIGPARRIHAPRCEQLVQRLTPPLRPYAHQHIVGRLLHLAAKALTP